MITGHGSMGCKLERIDGSPSCRVAGSPRCRYVAFIKCLDLRVNGLTGRRVVTGDVTYLANVTQSKHTTSLTLS